MFNREVGKVSGFLMVCRLYIRMRIRKLTIEEQIQWVLSYVWGGSADIWKENILEDLEAEILEYALVEESLADLKKEFGRGDDEIIKMAKLKKVK